MGRISGDREFPPFARSLPVSPDASREARRFVSEVLSLHRGRLPEVIDVAVLLTSELASNATRHSGSEHHIGLVVRIGTSSMRVSVTDEGSGFNPDEVTVGHAGWGLMLVRKLSSRWGVNRGERGTEVWFELDLPEPS